jgi:hypothetical protein
MHASAFLKQARLESGAFYGAIRSIGYMSVTKSSRSFERLFTSKLVYFCICVDFFGFGEDAE